MVPALAQAAPILPAGTVISNTAYGQYVDARSATDWRVTSNTVQAVVAPVPGAQLSTNQVVSQAPGTQFVLPHTLTNTGNSSQTYTISLSQSSSQSVVAQGLEVLLDAASSGVPSASDPVLATTSKSATITLAQGQSASLLLVGQVPQNAPSPSAIDLGLAASALGVSVSNSDVVQVVQGASLSATLQASTLSPNPGQQISLRASVANRGQNAAQASAWTVNGAPSALVVLELPVPAQTQFSGVATANAGATVLYHVAGTPANAFTTVQPAASSIDEVAWGAPALAPGETLSGTLDLAVSASATGLVSAQAQGVWTQAGLGQNTPSNLVSLSLPQNAAVIGIYSNGSYSTQAAVISAGQPLYVQFTAGQCNTDPTKALSVPVQVSSSVSKDRETLSAVETAPNSGVFRIEPPAPTVSAQQHVVVPGDGVLEVLPNDKLTATVNACGSTSLSISASVLVDPSGVVYNSASDQLVPGAVVSLIDVTGQGNGGKPGQAAQVFEADGVTPAPAAVTTQADGQYAFPLVQPSTYEIKVTPPAGFAFPSQLAPSQQPLDRSVDAQGSYGQPFVLSGQGPVRFDVPLDPSTQAAGKLFVQKTASTSTAQVGTFVDYAVTLNNQTGQALPSVVLHDHLPLGFAYVHGSARWNGHPLADPAGAPGPALDFALGAVSAGAQPVLTYRVLLGAASDRGTGVNTAQAQDGSLLSNQASASVQVVGGVFSSDGYIIGKVYADCSGKGVQTRQDPGIAGVRVYLENGQYAVSDGDGKFSFYGISSRTHVAHVDATTLPEGAQLELLDNAQARDPSSRFVAVGPGELAKANFALGPCTPSLRAQIAARAKAWKHPSEIAQAAKALLQQQSTTTTDPRQLPAAAQLGLPGTVQAGAAAPLRDVGVLGAVGDQGAQSAHAPKGAQPPAQDKHLASSQTLQDLKAAPAPALPLERVLEQLAKAAAPKRGRSAQAGFIGLHNGQVLDSTQTWVRVWGPAGAQLQLLVNGASVPAKQVGKKAVLSSKNLQAWEYVGVLLHPGSNTLELHAIDPFGNVRQRSRIQVVAPGPLARVLVQAPAHAQADAKTLIPVHVRLQDAHGIAVGLRTEVTLAASDGRWQLRDADPLQPGLQAYVEGGQATFMLLAPAQAGVLRLSVQAAGAQGKAHVLLDPYLRPLLAVGLASVRMNLSHLSPSSIQDSLSTDGFAQEIQGTAASFDAGHGTLSARTSFFLKGKVLGSSLLTLAYDSNKPSSSSLLRDINPNAYYPVYGDSSIKGFDARSTGKLYVLLQHGQSSFLLGDFTTQSQDPARNLTQVSRVLHGVQASWQGAKWKAHGFASQTSDTQEVVEFRANGTSGPFQLNLNGVQGSAQVSVVVRDKNQPSVVVKTTTLSEFTDYTLEPFTGLLTLNQPVPSLDADLNPVYIRVVYEINQGGPKHWVAESDVTYRQSKALSVGAMNYVDQDSAAGLRLQGLYATWKLFAHATLLAELAKSESLQYGAGVAQRLDLQGEIAGASVHAWAIHTTAGFSNPSALQQQGASQYGVKLDRPLDPKNRLQGQVLASTNSLTQASQDGAKLDVVHSLPGNAHVRAGLRYSRVNAQALLSAPIAPGASAPAIQSAPNPTPQSVEQTSYLAARVKLDAPVPHLKGADAYVLGEQSVSGPGREVGVGANYQVSPSTRLYVRHDFANTLASPYLLDASVSQYTTVAGVSSTFAQGTQAFDEYRVGNNLDGQTVEDALGLKHEWLLKPGLGLNAGFQEIRPLAGPSTDQSTAVNTGLSYTASANWKASGQVQWQRSSTSSSYFVTLAQAQRLSESWTLLNRGMWSLQKPTGPAAGLGSGDRKLVDLQSGFALRPPHEDVWNALGQVEYKRTLDGSLSAGGAALDQTAWIGALNLNVQPSRTWDASLRYAIERAVDHTSGVDSSALTQLIGGTSSWDLTPRWDAGVQAYRMWGAGQSARSQGVHVGYLLGKNLWLTVGYNLTGFSASDLQGEAYTDKGFFLQLRMKFTESVFQGWGGSGT